MFLNFNFQKKIKLLVVIFALAIFFGSIYKASAGIIFEDNFDNQPDWWYVQARPDSSCSTNRTANGCTGQACDQYNRRVTEGGLCSPNDWSGARNEEAWNPYDISGTTPQVPNSHPTIQISNENHTGATGKGLTIWTESHKGWSGDGWGADAILAKKFSQDYPELYVRFKFKLQPDSQWTNYNNGSQMKIFRVEHNDWGAPSMFQNFEYGYNAPALLVQVGVGWDGTTPLLGSSHQTRCDPQGDAVNYNGVTYRCLTDHVSSVEDTPINSPNWVATSLNTYYPAWEPNKAYYKPNYWCPDKMGYITSSRFVDSNGIENTNVLQTLGDGNWHTLEYHVKVNSSNGVADGSIYQHWVDGFLKVDKKDDRVFLGNGATPGTGWNVVALGGNANNNFKQITSNFTWSMINYNGKSYKCIKSHTSNGTDIIPTNTEYWAETIYSSWWRTWTTGITFPATFSQGSYIADAEQWYAFDDIVVSTTPISNDYVIGEPQASTSFNTSNFITLIQNYLKKESNNVYDLNSDGIINSRDLGIMMSKWN